MAKKNLSLYLTGLKFWASPFLYLFFFKVSDLTSPPPRELYLLLLWNLAEIILFSRLTRSYYKEILTRFVSFPVAHLISLVWGFSFTWSPVLCRLSSKHNPILLNSLSFSCSPLGLLSLRLFPILLLLLSFLVCYEQTANLKFCLFTYIIKVSPNHRYCNQIHVSATLVN